MSEILLADEVRLVCLKAFNMNASHVIDAVQEPDHTDKLEQDGLVLFIHCKKSSSTKTASSIIAIEEQKQGRRAVHFAIKTYSDLQIGFDELSPTHKLEAIASKFGVEVVVGSLRSRFIWSASIPVRSPQEIQVDARNSPIGAELIQQFYIKFEDGPQARAVCALCFCIDATSYAHWLRRHQR